MSKPILILFAMVVGLMLSLVLENHVVARGPYQHAFEKVYPELAAKKINCRICHPRGSEDNMKSRNHYSIALEMELGEKKIKDEQRVMDALRKIEVGKCRSGKWSERIEKGLAPCVCGAVEPESNVLRRWLKSADYELR